jgi:general secretion pathway protein K
LVVIGLLITHLTASGRSEAKIASNMLANAQAAAAADGGIAEAIFHLGQADRRVRWGADGAAHTVKIGSALVSVRSWDESGRVNPNLASNALMNALFQAIGVEAFHAERLAEAIGSWHDLVRQSRPGGVGAADYAAAGLDYGPPGTLIEKIDELGRVLGMTPDLLKAVRPYLSLWNQSELPLLAVADPVVVQAVAQLAKTSRNTAPQPVVSSRLTVSIEATGKVSSGASFTRLAVVRIGPDLEKGYQILAWDTVLGD